SQRRSFVFKTLGDCFRRLTVDGSVHTVQNELAPARIRSCAWVALQHFVGSFQDLLFVRETDPSVKPAFRGVSLKLTGASLYQVDFPIHQAAHVYRHTGFPVAVVVRDAFVIELAGKGFGLFLSQAGTEDQCLWCLYETSSISLSGNASVH